VNIWQSDKHEDGCLVHFVRLATTMLKDKEFTRRPECGEKQLSMLTVVTPILKLPGYRIYQTSVDRLQHAN